MVRGKQRIMIRIRLKMINGNGKKRFVCLFVCLFNRSLRAETHLGPDGTRLEQNAQAMLKSLYKHAGQLVYGNVKREKQI